MGIATTDNSKLVRSTNSIFARKNIGVTIEKMHKKFFQKFGVSEFCQMTAELRF